MLTEMYEIFFLVFARPEAIVAQLKIEPFAVTFNSTAP